MDNAIGSFLFNRESLSHKLLDHESTKKDWWNFLDCYLIFANFLKRDFKITENVKQTIGLLKKIATKNIHLFLRP